MLEEYVITKLEETRPKGVSVPSASIKPSETQVVH